MKINRNTILVFILLSCIMHISAGLLLYSYLSRYSGGKEEQIIEIDLENGGWKIADIEPPEKEEVPKKARFLGMYNSSVKEETVSSGFPRAPGRPAHRGGGDIDKLKRDADGLYGRKTKEFASLGPGSLDRELGAEKLPEDFYPDYKRGGHTYLNVMKHPDVAYFVRLKRVFKLAWDPTDALMRGRSNGEISRGSIKVVLGLAINPEGDIDELFVINGSGMDEYDQEAIRAVRVSAPFSAPPRKLAEADGMLRLTWTFVVYL